MSTWTAVADVRAEQIDALEQRVNELVIALAECREQCAMNLDNPGNEDDTLNYVLDAVNDVLKDDYYYVPENYDD